ncbi:MAG: lipoprotein [Pseudomonadota bacterium]
MARAIILAVGVCALLTACGIKGDPISPEEGGVTIDRVSEA